MKPDDDPEDRIRQLEQPLADYARASELGGTQPPGYAYTPPPPPPPYGSYPQGLPYSGAAPRSSSGSRVIWVVAAFVVIGVLVLIGGIFAVATHRFSHGGSVAPTTPSAGPASAAPRTVPSIALPPIPSVAIPTIPSAPTAPSGGPPAGGTITVSGVSESRTIACSDNIVNVSGVSNIVTITGHCASLTVSGVKNSITVDAVDTITASGLQNQVTYHSGSPKITKSGQSNVVQQG
ncbi:DUF3060 domain-containing protein [Mycobacterium sp.]|uniref:DUF3060 domain-containing protein n=1 Tax=Mycobacterium sp. TaxID=1785 RepID=UPI002B93F16E|nr:DUF3060 domain-containing protein [Mycobacterium sp.]HTQ18946.1 DUF3060 domain-containing protein [Mycobacterium sp.]